MMPGMSGIELIVKIKEISPDVKSFLMTSFEINALKSEIVKSALEILNNSKTNTFKGTYYDR